MKLFASISATDAPKEYDEFLPEKRFTPSKNEIILAELSLGNKLKEINKNKYKGVSYSIYIDGETRCYFKFGNDYAIMNYLITEVSVINSTIQWDIRI